MVDSIAVRGWAVPFLDSNGDPVDGGTVEFYDAGTTDAREVFSTKDLSTTSLGTTVDLNSAGVLVNDSNALVVVYTGTTDYKVIIKDSGGNSLQTYDNIKGAIDTSSFGTGSGTFSTEVDASAGDITIVAGDAGKLKNLDCSGGDITATLPSAVTVGDGYIVGIRHNGTANEIRIATVSGQTIQLPGSTTTSGYSLTGLGHTVWLTSDGGGWVIPWVVPPLLAGGINIAVFHVADFLTAPPTSPEPGARYIITGTPTGDWASFAEHDVVEADGQGSWIVYTPPTDCGWLAYDQDSNTQYQFRASAWVGWPNVTAADPDDLSVAVVAHQETQGTNGSASTSTSGWNLRTLNTEKSDPDGIVSLASNQFTLTAGSDAADTFLIIASGVFFQTGPSQMRLYNDTDSSVVAYSHPVLSDSTVGDAISAPLQAYITIAAGESKAFQFEYNISSAKTDGMGPASNLGTEEYLTCTIIKLETKQGPQGDQGDPGAVGSDGGISFWNWETSTSSGPSSGAIRMDNATLASVTEIYIHETDGNSVDMSAFLATLDDSGSTIKGQIYLHEDKAGSNFWLGQVTALTDNGSDVTLSVTHLESNGSFDAGDDIKMEFYRTGDVGNTGSTGSNGQVLIDYTMDAASQIDADPGSGMIRANNATAASVTAFYIDDLDRLGVDQSTAIDGFDVSTSSGAKATMYMEDLTSGERWTYSITAVSDSTGYWQIDVTHVAGTGSFASNNVAITVIPRGDTGSGDVTGVGSSVDNEIVLFDGTGGKTIKRATTTGVLRATSGVIAAAPATDLGAGDHMIPILASQMIPRTTNGAAEGTSELATNDIMLQTLDFDTTTEEGAGFWFPMPESWNEGTVTFQAIWTAGSGSGGVAWGLAAYAFSDNDALDTAVSGQQVVTDTFITANDCHITSESSAITIGGTPAAGDLVYFEVTREVANGSDTLAVDALLIGLRLFITTDALND